MLALPIIKITAHNASKDTAMTTQTLDDTAIRETAYLFWLGEGQPAGRDQDHWLRAIDALTPAKRKPVAKKAAAKKAAPKAAAPKKARATKATNPSA